MVTVIKIMTADKALLKKDRIKSISTRFVNYYNTIIGNAILEVVQGGARLYIFETDEEMEHFLEDNKTED